MHNNFLHKLISLYASWLKIRRKERIKLWNASRFLYMPYIFVDIMQKKWFQLVAFLLIVLSLIDVQLPSTF